MTLFQCSFQLVRLDFELETGSSKVSLSTSTVSRTLCISLFWGRMLQTMRKYVTLASWGTSCLWMKKQVLVPCMYPILWKKFPISFAMSFLYFSSSWPLMRYRYYCEFPVSGKMTALDLPGCNISFPVTWSMTFQSSSSGRTRGVGLLGL